MRTIIYALILSVLPSLASAQQLLLTVKGCYRIDVLTDGTPVLTDLKIPPANVVDLRTTPPTVPPTTPPTTPPNPTDPVATHRATVQAATDKVVDTNKANTKIALSKLYQTTSGLPVTSRDQLVQSTDLLFNALNLPSAWKTWKAEIDKSLLSFVAVDDAKKGWQIVAEVLSK